MRNPDLTPWAAEEATSLIPSPTATVAVAPASATFTAAAAASEPPGTKIFDGFMALTVRFASEVVAEETRLKKEAAGDFAIVPWGVTDTCPIFPSGFS